MAPARVLVSGTGPARSVPYRDIPRTASRQNKNNKPQPLRFQPELWTDMRHAQSKLLFGYWNDLRGNRSVPERSEIEPGSIRSILGDTFILEIDELMQPAYRLAGTRLCAAFGRELKGECFVKLTPPSERSYLKNIVSSSIEDSAPCVIGMIGTTARDRVVELETVLLPLAHHGETGLRVFGVTTPSKFHTWIGSDPISTLSVTSARFFREDEDEGFLKRREEGRITGVEPPPLALEDEDLVVRRIGHLRVLEGGKPAGD